MVYVLKDQNEKKKRKPKVDPEKVKKGVGKGFKVAMNIGKVVGETSMKIGKRLHENMEQRFGDFDDEPKPKKRKKSVRKQKKTKTNSKKHKKVRHRVIIEIDE
jgi:hypothetical protein